MGTFRIFCVNKKRTKPAGWFDPEGEPEHFSKAESARQSRCPPTLKLWRTSRHRGTARTLLSLLPRFLLGKTRLASTLLRKKTSCVLFFILILYSKTPTGVGRAVASLGSEAFAAGMEYNQGKILKNLKKSLQLSLSGFGLLK